MFPSVKEASCVMDDRLNDSSLLCQLLKAIWKYKSWYFCSFWQWQLVSVWFGREHYRCIECHALIDPNSHYGL
jgi:hypothetical protein